MNAEESGQSAEHDSYQRDEDPGGGAGLTLLVVANQAAVLHQPGESAFDDPALGQHAEAADVVVAFDHLHFQLGTLRSHPVGELGTGVAAIDPELAQPGEIRQQRLQQGLRTRSFGRVGRLDRSPEHQPEGVYQEKAFAALGLFGGIVAHLAPVRIGTDGLAVEHRGGRPTAFADGGAGQGSEAVVEGGPDAVATPPVEVMIDRLPRWEAFGQEAPRTAAFDKVENGVEDQPQRSARTTPALGRRQVPLNELPLGVGEIGVVRGDLHRLESAAAKVGHLRQRTKSSLG